MATVPRAWVDGYADSLEMISDAMRRRLADELSRIDYTQDVAVVREALIAIMQAYCYESRAMAAQAAAEFYDGLRESEVGERMGAVAYDGYDPVRVERRVHSVVEPLAKVQRRFGLADGGRLDDPDAEVDYRERAECAGEAISRALVDYQGWSIKSAAGGTVFGNGKRDGRKVKYARVPRGSKHYPSGCPFCQMLASRGFAYRSALVAGGLDPDHYHSDCQCMVVPSWGKGSVEGYDPHDYDEGYQEWLDQDHSKHEAHVAETQRNESKQKRQFEKHYVQDTTSEGDYEEDTERRTNGVTLHERDLKTALRCVRPVFISPHGNELLVANIRRIKPRDGWYDVHAHGAPGSVRVFGTAGVEARELAFIITHRDDYHGEPIRLFSCHSAEESEDGRCTGRELASIMGVDVDASPGRTIINSDGTFVFAETGTSEFVPFHGGGGGE